jgi:transcriptional regulator with XRE-family HTH domain
MEDVRAILARNIKAARKLLELSQEELADRAEIDRTYVSGIERQLSPSSPKPSARQRRNFLRTDPDSLSSRREATARVKPITPLESRREGH